VVGRRRISHRHVDDAPPQRSRQNCGSERRQEASPGARDSEHWFRWLVSSSRRICRSARPHPAIWTGERRPSGPVEVVPTEADGHPRARWRSRRKVTGVARAALAGLVVGFAISVLIAGVEDRHTRGDLAVCRAFASLAPFGPRPTPAQAQRALDDARSAHPRDQELARIAKRTFRIDGQLAFRPADVDYLRSVCHALGVGLALGS